MTNDWKLMTGNMAHIDIADDYSHKIENWK
jgi:hypothetical protein